MLLTLLQVLNTTDLKEVINVLGKSLPALDIFLLLEDEQANGNVKIDKKKNKIKALKEPGDLYYDSQLFNKIVRMIEHFDKRKENITKWKLDMWSIGEGQITYPAHDYLCTIYALEQSPTLKLNKYEITVPKIKGKREAATFTFYTFVDHQEFGAKAVNAFIDEWQKIIIAENKKTK